MIPSGESDHVASPRDLEGFAHNLGGSQLLSGEGTVRFDHELNGLPKVLSRLLKRCTLGCLLYTSPSPRDS